MKLRWRWFVSMLATAVVCTSAFSMPSAQIFTTTADFGLGVMKGISTDPADQLRLSTVSETEPYIWIANHTAGRVTKIDTRSGQIVGQYYSTVAPGDVLPDNIPGQTSVPPQGSNLQSPSRTAVDLDGNVYVANRANVASGQQGTLTKIAGSRAYGIDRDHDGHIDTSNGSGDLKPEDECLLWTVKVGSPGTIPRGVAVDSQNNVWVGTFTDARIYQFNGQTGQLMQTISLRDEAGVSGIEIYGLAIGLNGMIYTTSLEARWACRVNPGAVAGARVQAIRTGFPGYGLAVDKNGVEWIGRYETGNDGFGVQAVDWRMNPPVVSYGRAPMGGRTRGVAVDGEGNVWVSNYEVSKLMKFSPTGQYLAGYDVASGPIGVAVDAAGKIWAVGSTTCSRIDPVSGIRDDFSAGGEAYSYSDMTGFQLRNYTARQGTWAVAVDGGSYRAKWNQISWNTSQPSGTLVRVEARTSENMDWMEAQPWVEVTSGAQLAGLAGRYLEVRVTMRVITGEQSPELYDLTIAPPTPGPDALSTSIAGAKLAGEHTVVSLAGKSVTYVDNGIFYLEEPTRHCGIGVRSYDQVKPGDIVTVKGEVAVVNGECILLDGFVSAVSEGAKLSPFVVTNKGLGGGSFGAQPGVVGASGTSNVGLLVTTTGRVTATGKGFYYVDDGVGLKDGSGNVGVKVVCPEGTSCPVGSYVTVTGISSSYAAPVGVARQIRQISRAYGEYTEDFESTPGVEWSNRSVSLTPKGPRKFLGEFSNESVTLSLDKLAAHTEMTLSFDVYMMKSWDAANYGPDIFDAGIVGGPTLVHSTFALYEDTIPQTYPDPYPGEPAHPARTGAAENNTLGYMFAGRPMDCVYHMEFTIPHTADAAQIKFSGVNLQGVGDESWGLDNVHIRLK